MEAHPVLFEERGRSKLLGCVLLVKLFGYGACLFPNFPRFEHRILYLHPDVIAAGCLDVNKTYSQVALRFHWEGMRKYV